MKALVIGFLMFASLAAVVFSDQYDDSRAIFAVIARAPAKARDQKNPYEGQPDAIAAGQKLFRQHCAECHGDDARGRGRAVDLHSPAVQNASPGELAWFLRSGNPRHGMPSWSGLPEQRRWQIVAYLKTLP
jgi:mono/diheme cytochrome c family protein